MKTNNNHNSIVIASVSEAIRSKFNRLLQSLRSIAMTYTTPGFTLQEMLIAITVFMIFLGVASGSYISIVKSNKKAADSQALYNETRMVFDALADGIRAGKIDYSCLEVGSMDSYCSDAGNPTEKHTLAILQDGGRKRVIFRYFEDEKRIKKLEQTANAGIVPWASAEWIPITSEKFPMENLTFKVFPMKDPYATENAEEDAVQFQPSVTVNLDTKNYTFRTVYAERAYGRKSIYEK